MDLYNLERFVDAQASAYERALAEIRGGRKESHWMWFIFPQMAGLGRSYYANFYGIGSKHEAEVYLEHPVLGKRLRDITQAFYGLEGGPKDILGSPDYMM